LTAKAYCQLQKERDQTNKLLLMVTERMVCLSLLMYYEILMKPLFPLMLKQCFC